MKGSRASPPCKQVASVAGSSSDPPQWDTSSAFLPQFELLSERRGRKGDPAAQRD